MANKLKMADIEKIEGLLRLGWSRRRIACELGLDRGAVRRYADRAESKAAIPLAGTVASAGVGSEARPPDGEARADIPLTGVSAERAVETTNVSAPTKAHRAAGRQSKCAAFAEAIPEGLAAGLTAQRIFQDLRADHGFAGGYYSVQRFVRRLSASTPLPFRRVETAAGEEAQIDFGQGAPTMGPGSTSLADEDTPLNASIRSRLAIG